MQHVLRFCVKLFYHLTDIFPDILNLFEFYINLVRFSPIVLIPPFVYTIKATKEPTPASTSPDKQLFLA